MEVYQYFIHLSKMYKVKYYWRLFSDFWACSTKDKKWTSEHLKDYEYWKFLLVETAVIYFTNLKQYIKVLLNQCFDILL